MMKNITEPSPSFTQSRTFLIAAGFLGVLAIVVLVLVSIAYAMLTSSATQTYTSPGMASGEASDIAVLTPRGASDAIPAFATSDTEKNVEQLDPAQTVPTTPPVSPDMPGKPLDPTNRGTPQHDLDNLF